MNISILCSSEEHPVNAWLKSWISVNKSHHVELLRKKSELKGGDILFLISCTEILTKDELSLYKKTLVIHASDLPNGRGWNPHIWQILEGKTQLVVSLIEAGKDVDSGDIWHKVTIEIPKHYLFDEINNLLFDTEIRLMDYAVSNFDKVVPQQQSEQMQATYYPKRNPDDSEIDPNRSIKEQFDLIRVCDPIRYPAYFELHGQKYTLKIEKIK